MTNLHTARIEFLKYLSNGYVASSSSDFSIHIWDPNTWTSIQIFTGHLSTVYGLDQIDSDTIVSGSDNGNIFVWSIRTGVIQMTILTGRAIYSVRYFSPSNSIIYGLSTGQLQIKSYVNPLSLILLNGHALGSSARSIEILNERFIASGGDDMNIIIWDLTSFTNKYILTDHSAEIICLKRLSDTVLASSGNENIVILWNWLTGVKLFTLTGYQNQIWLSGLDLYDNQTLISASLDQTITFWNIANGALIQTINADIQVNAIVVIKASKNEKRKMRMDFESFY